MLLKLKKKQQMRKGIFHTMLMLFLNGLVMAGCQEKTIDDERKECLEKRKKL